MAMVAGRTASSDETRRSMERDYDPTGATTRRGVVAERRPRVEGASYRYLEHEATRHAVERVEQRSSLADAVSSQRGEFTQRAKAAGRLSTRAETEHDPRSARAHAEASIQPATRARGVTKNARSSREPNTEAMTTIAAPRRRLRQCDLLHRTSLTRSAPPLPRECAPTSCVPRIRLAPFKTRARLHHARWCSAARRPPPRATRGPSVASPRLRKAGAGRRGARACVAAFCLATATRGRAVVQDAREARSEATDATSSPLSRASDYLGSREASRVSSHPRENTHRQDIASEREMSRRRARRIDATAFVLVSACHRSDHSSARAARRGARTPI